MTGAYITKDGGASWRMFNLGSVPSAFAFDPSRPQRIYAAAEAVYRSDDSGRTWPMVLPDPAKNTVEQAIGDHADFVIMTDDPAYPGSGRSVTVHAIAVDPDDPRRVFVAVSTADSPVPARPPRATLLLGSTDGGARGPGSRTSAPSASSRFGRGRRGGAAVHAVGETGVYEGAGRPGSTSRLRARPLHLRRHRTRPPLGSGARLCDPAAGPHPGHGGTGRGRIGRARDRRGRPGVRGRRSHLARRQWLPAGGRARGRPRRRVGGGVRVAALTRADRGLLPRPARGLRGPAGDRLPGRGEAPFNGIAKTTDGGRTWSVVHEESDRPSPNLAAPGSSRARRPTATRSGSTPRTTSRWRPTILTSLRDRPLPHLPHHRRGQRPGRRSTPSGAATTDGRAAAST